MGFIERVMHPDWYHGFGGKVPFFEGWYYKLIDADGVQKWAVIPGVFLSDDPHAFIQVLDGSSQTAFYHRYPLDADLPQQYVPPFMLVLEPDGMVTAPS